MLDLIIRGGQVIDGTGAVARRADVGVLDGRIVVVGDIDEPGRREVNADGLFVTPGFIDVHTHYDAQACWDGTLSPSPLHGVTSVFSGNCGFTLAPIEDQDKDYMLNMLSRVEGMPIEALESGVGWNWSTTAEYLDQFEGRVMPNVGFLVGHSALRRAVMHEEATERAATAAEIEAMRALLAAGLAAGGMGFSSTWSPTHTDHRGVPVPSRSATRQELISLSEVVGQYPGTALEFIPDMGLFSDDIKDLMASMSRAADRVLNWNMLMIYPGNEDVVDSQLSAGDYAAEHGGKVVALTLPEPGKLRLSFQSGVAFDAIPGWGPFFRLPIPERLQFLADPERRAELDRTAQTAPKNLLEFVRWGRYRLETFSPEAGRFNGGTVAEAAAALGLSDWEAVCVVLRMDQLRTGFFMPARGDDPATWERRRTAWRDSRTLMGASDAGAHLDTIDTFSYTTRLLEVAVRQQPLLPAEEAVRMLTGDPAALYGLRDRGRIAAGYAADLVVLDLDRVSAGLPLTRHDLPGGSARLYSEPAGVEHVFVNGVQVVEGNKLGAERPGVILRSGRDTQTIRARA